MKDLHVIIMESLSPGHYLKNESYIIAQIKKSLYTMIQHNMVSYELHKRGYVLYSMDAEAVMCRQRFPRYIYSAKMIYNDPGMCNYTLHQILLEMFM